MSNALMLDEVGRKVIIRFNRPEIRCPLSVGVIEELLERLGDLNTRADLGTIIFTGSGDVFASGADLREIAALEPVDAANFAGRGQALMNTISAMSAHTVAAVNGFCFGGALDLALACDKRIASPAATFAHPGATLGIMTGWGGTQRLPRLIGEARALEMFFTARRVSADEALSIGLVDEVADEPLGLALKTIE
ncbi:MAG TPA: enoyl-CoA hydratase/isomerase family protein [Pyrinomonadaceae bacterium]|nr:enoyl-CoA hydratase/isomerase family protein [Pyrinomonadaceae bacterium]